jgi:DNA modification methylase
MTELNNLKENQNIDISELKEKLAEVIDLRRAVGLRLSDATRKDRPSVLIEHRKIKAEEYKLEEKIAEINLSETDPANKTKWVLANKKFNKLLSRLEHQDWLQWTRSIWKFKEMESEAKTGKHPAQFSAVVPERVIKMFSINGEVVLDPFVGSGTTCVEATKYNRRSIGLDVNTDFLSLAEQRLKETKGDSNLAKLIKEDARNMISIADSSIQLIMTHPPYWNCVKISDLEDDLSNCDNGSYQQFLEAMRQVLKECFRVLESDRVAAFMVGDIMRKVEGITQLFPFHSDLLQIAQSIGFIPWDIYIVETKMKNSGGMPMMGSYPYPHKIFAQFAHNYLLILRKPV